MTLPVLLAVLVMLIGGAAVAMQAPINAYLGKAVADPVLAACISFGVGFAALIVICFMRGAWSALGTAASLPWWALTGGLLGAFYVAAAAWSVPKLGVVATLAAVTLGQMVMALILDAVGAFGVEVQGIAWQRLLAVILVVAGLVLSRLY